MGSYIIRFDAATGNGEIDLAMIRRRAILALTILFGGIILILAYSGIESSRKNMLRLLRQEGESLMQALVTSARNNLASSTIVEEAATERLVDISTLLGALLNGSATGIDALGDWQKRYRLERIDLVDGSCRISASSVRESVGDTVSGDPDMLAVLDSVLLESRSLAVARPMPSALPQDDYTYLALRTKRGVMLLSAKVKKLTDYQEWLGIGFVLRQLGDQPGIDYVVLQSSSGIVLASRSIQQMVAVEADSFLADALESEQTTSRIYNFEGRRLLEVVRAFKSDVLPSGLLRLGMSLDVYDQLYAGSLKQLAILSLVLFVLGIVGSYAATSFKRLQVAEVNLEQLQSVTDEIVQSLEAGVVAVNREGMITIFNPQAERLFAKSAAAIMNQPYRSIFADDLLSLGKIESRSQQAHRGEVRYSSTPTQLRHLLVSSVPICGKDNTYSGAVALVYDLTEIKQLEENARAAERLTELGSLAAGVAHEIRNPLNAISIATQRLRSEFEPNTNAAEYQSFLRTIAEEIDRLNTIIKDFLSLARSGHIEKVLVDLQGYFDDIVTLARLESEKQHIAIAVDIEPGLTAVRLDRQEMKKVFLNLIKNAVQAIDTHGTIGITAWKQSSGQVAIDISNSGQPITPDVRDRIWQPYFTTRKDGTGLGLAICRRIIADHGGTI
ncbi:MAG: ATP-binding protein [candidate division Zixibacteria bacterium]|nr:ATP-binding protein [candidate division Zixibacteria bacterium]